MWKSATSVLVLHECFIFTLTVDGGSNCIITNEMICEVYPTNSVDA